jgi:hypothetical protein
MGVTGRRSGYPCLRLSRNSESCLFDEIAHCGFVEGPIEFAAIANVAQNRHTGAVAIFQLLTVVHPNTVEIGQACLRQHGQCLVAQVAIIALIEDEWGHT